jgi:hypothetical protein
LAAAMSIYLELTRELNQGRVRAVLCGGQACVLHRLAFASKDGGWMLREDDEATQHVLGVLERRGARYRFGAPLASRWLTGGWSSHFEFMEGDIRVRTDFFSRPPRLTESDRKRVWSAAELAAVPFTDARATALMKMTDRERDWAFVGELARLMPDARDQLLFSRSAWDILQLAAEHPAWIRELSATRPLLARTTDGLDALETELDRERRRAMHANEARLERYAKASRNWAAIWSEVQRELADQPLSAAHSIMVSRASAVLPMTVIDEEVP